MVRIQVEPFYDIITRVRAKMKLRFNYFTLNFILYGLYNEIDSKISRVC